jgi:hypothetical protein
MSIFAMNRMGVVGPALAGFWMGMGKDPYLQSFPAGISLSCTNFGLLNSYIDNGAFFCFPPKQIRFPYIQTMIGNSIFFDFSAPPIGSRIQISAGMSTPVRKTFRIFADGLSLNLES